MNKAQLIVQLHALKFVFCNAMRYVIDTQWQAPHREFEHLIVCLYTRCIYDVDIQRRAIEQMLPVLTRLEYNTQIEAARIKKRNAQKAVTAGKKMPHTEHYIIINELNAIELKFAKAEFTRIRVTQFDRDILAEKTYVRFTALINEWSGSQNPPFAPWSLVFAPNPPTTLSVISRTLQQL